MTGLCRTSTLFPYTTLFRSLIESDGDAPARVSAEVARWIPIAPEGTGDIAVLRVRDPLPEGARMPPLRRVDQLWDHTFRVDRKSTRLNSSHLVISYAVFCLR